MNSKRLKIDTSLCSLQDLVATVTVCNHSIHSNILCVKVTVKCRKSNTRHDSYVIIEIDAFSYLNVIGVNSLPLSGVNSRFLAPSRFPAFHLKCPAFLAYFELEKMHSMRSFQRQVELRRLGNQLPVLGKANSLFKLVKCCVFSCLLSCDLVRTA